MMKRTLGNYTEKSAGALAARLRAAAGAYPAVAFDVFDTLLYRCAARPADVFRLMERSGKVPAGFAQKRLEAEAQARAAAPGREITLKEIYARLPGLDPAAELAAERDFAAPNPVLLAFYRWCRAQGKRVYVISDMYLPQGQIRAMLAACGYDAFDGVFVSGEYGVQKRSGKLFARFLRQTGLACGQVLFVGDDRRADFIGAALCSVRCLLLPRRSLPAYLPQPADAVQGSVYAAVRCCAEAAPAGQGRAFALGAELLGPLLAGFCDFLHRQRAGRLLFLARDMDLARRVYGRLYPGEATGYLRVSRRSLCPAALRLGRREVLLALLPRQKLTAAGLAAYCGFAGFDAVAPLAGCMAESAVDLRGEPEAAALRLLDALIAAARQSAAMGEQAALCREYLQAAGVFRPGTVLVDIGSGGTTQWVLRALGAGELRGAYLARDDRLRRRFTPDQAAVYLFDDAPAPLWYWAGQPMLELFLSEPCGTAAGYRRSGGGVQAVLADAPGPGAQAVIGALRSGGMACAVQVAKLAAWGVQAGPRQGIAPFLALVRRPALAEAALFGPLQVEDGGVWPLAQPGRRVGYLLHPKALAADLKAARWKIAFLRRLLLLPLPYDRVYRALKRPEP